MYRFSVPCLMGVEGLVADELKFKGFEQVQAENGRVLFTAAGLVPAGEFVNVRITGMSDGDLTGEIEE